MIKALEMHFWGSGQTTDFLLGNYDRPTDEKQTDTMPRHREVTLALMWWLGWYGTGSTVATHTTSTAAGRTMTDASPCLLSCANGSAVKKRKIFWSPLYLLYLCCRCAYVQWPDLYLYYMHKEIFPITRSVHGGRSVWFVGGRSISLLKFPKRAGSFTSMLQ